MIVESPKKAKSINKFLGSAYVVKASMGHVRDLAQAQARARRCPGLQAVVRRSYRPRKTRSASSSEPPRRPGSSISRPTRIVKAKPSPGTCNRLWTCRTTAFAASTFHEITERAVKDAFSRSGPINMEMVNAQQARRFLDRFVGYQLSPLLWKKVGARNLSAGRVQSVAVRLIADRERDIRAFVTEEYWKIAATVSPAGSTAATDQFKASLAEYDGAKFEAKNEAGCPRRSATLLQSVPYVVSKIDETEKLDKADAPFKTSTLQQQAAIRLRFSGKKTMKVAQELYEGIDVDGSGPGRLDHLHAYRQPAGVGRCDDRRAREDQERVWRSLPARQADPLRCRQECPGGPRGHSPHRPVLHAGKDQGLTEPRPVPALPAHLRAVRRQPDGPCRLHGDRRGDRRRRRDLQGPGQGAEIRRPPAGLAARRQAGRRAAANLDRRPARSTCTASTRPSISLSRHPATARPR